MGSVKRQADGELVQGTLDMLILKTLQRGPQHGYGVAQHIQQISDEVLRVEEGSLYPALHRLEKQGWFESEWRMSEASRRARYHKLTPKRRRQLAAEQSK